MSESERQRLLTEQRNRQREEADRQTASGLAQQAASQGAFAAPGYWEEIGSPDIARKTDGDHIEDYFATEFSSAFPFGNVTYDDWQSWRWRIETEFELALNEFRDPNSTLDEGDLAEMYGEVRPELTDERARRIRSSSEVKKAKTSLAVGAQGLRAGTEIHAVARSESPVEDTDPDGYLDRFKQWASR